ncbi:MAG TPA: DNA alkylation repair protein [Anaerolineales bacterium]|nr:DNA alkylation repair protein [Anaerolineales bacterium]
MKAKTPRFPKYHREVVQALTRIGNATFGKAVQQDRGSQLIHLGISVPELRKRVRQGFSFYELQEDEVLAVWDDLWQNSRYGDVLFAALEFYTPRAKKQVNPNLWSVVRHWSKRVDNWCHSDGLSALYSRILESNPAEVYPQMLEWNQSKSEWLRRISLVSLIHYSGKNAVFLPLKKVLPLITNCLEDERYYVQTAVGWVLREMGNVYEKEVLTYLETHIKRIRSSAFSRAIERRNAKDRAQLRKLRSAA